MGKPKSPKTRMKEYRERLKFNKEKYDQLKEKDRKRKQSSRKEQTQINSAVKAHRNNLNRQRVASFVRRAEMWPQKIIPTCINHLEH